MLVKDMIDVTRESIPLIFTKDCVKRTLKSVEQIPYDYFPVIDKNGRLIGGVDRADLLEKKEGTVKQIYQTQKPFYLNENESAIKLEEAFLIENANHIFVTDRDGFLLGGVSNKNRALPQVFKARNYISTPEIFDSMHDAIIIINIDAIIVYANHAYSQLVGIPIWRFLGKQVQEVEQSQKKRCLMIMRGEMEPLVNEQIRLNTINLDVIATIKPIFSGERVTGVICVFRSIDETLELSRKIERMEYMNEYLKNEIQVQSKLPKVFDKIIGKCSNFTEVLGMAAKVATSNLSVMIRGENGTGKEVVANAIHNASNRKSKPMIRVNCAAIPELLLESELFGYESGAFTGAQKGGKIGKFELADKGTIFLDEVGDMSLAMQAKILRVIQEKQLERVGGNETINVDVRIIAATNKNLEKMVEEETFREDLYYRLNVVPIMLPPLRERKGDIPILIDYFMDMAINDGMKESIHLSKEVLDLIMNHDWKGNIRELRNVIEHAVVMCTRNMITIEDLPRYLIVSHSNTTTNLRELAAVNEKEAIVDALEKHNHNKSAAMRSLGISRRTFYKKLKKYELINE